jgi:hypothetical protein
MHLDNKSELPEATARVSEGANRAASVSFFLLSYDESALGPELHRGHLRGDPHPLL